MTLSFFQNPYDIDFAIDFTYIYFSYLVSNFFSFNRSGSVVVIFNLRFEQAVDINRIISVLKHAARDRKLGKLIIDPSSIAALQDYIHQTTRSPRVSSSGIWLLFSKVAGSGPHKQGISQAVQSQVSRKSKRLIHGNVTRSVTRCWDVSSGCLWAFKLYRCAIDYLMQINLSPLNFSCGVI